ncbi:MAG TPA: DUF488 family protein [Actinomycetales bacterium]|nr:DUF488 family protein [Actinomycetales bacterium]
MSVKVRRVYEDPNDDDGTRVLVDRLWPRGVSKERAALAEWCKQVAPSPELRRWFGHDPERYDQFVRRYHDELASGEQREALERLRRVARTGTLTLVTATKDEDHCAAEVLYELLRDER